MLTSPPIDELRDLTEPAPGRPLRIVLVTFYNYESHALRIFHPLLKQLGHDVHSIFFKNYFTYQVPTQTEEDMVVELVERLKPDVVGMSVWSTYYQLAARLSDRIKARVDPTIIWGGIHAQTKPADCIEHADLVCMSEGEYVLAELTDRLSLGQGYDDLRGCWVRTDDGVAKNPPRNLIPDLDVLPPADFTPDNKYYLRLNNWVDVERWNERALLYDIMGVRGCPFQCTFCIHNFTRQATTGLGTYLRRRSVDHVMAELHEALRQRPNLRVITFSDDIFAPPRPWLEEFCRRYKEEIRLPFAVYSYPGMVDEKRVSLMRDAGLWYSVMGIQSGSERIRRECYERETPTKDIVEACEILDRHGVGRNLDFIGDNPYETEADRRETVDLLCRLPKPFCFNYFSLTYFPGVELTDRALKDGLVQPTEVEDVAQKGYHLWGGALMATRPLEQVRWDVAYTLAVHGVPRAVLHRLLDSAFFMRHIRRFARLARAMQATARWRDRMLDRFQNRPAIMQLYLENTNRDQADGDAMSVQPNIDNSPFAQPIPARWGERSATVPVS